MILLLFYTRICTFVLQEKLQNSFRQATSKISATIGLGLPRSENNEQQPPAAAAFEDEALTIDADAVTDDNED